MSKPESYTPLECHNGKFIHPSDILSWMLWKAVSFAVGMFSLLCHARLPYSVEPDQFLDLCLMEFLFMNPPQVLQPLKTKPSISTGVFYYLSSRIVHINGSPSSPLGGYWSFFLYLLTHSFSVSIAPFHSSIHSSIQSSKKFFFPSSSHTCIFFWHLQIFNHVLHQTKFWNTEKDKIQLLLTKNVEKLSFLFMLR